MVIPRASHWTYKLFNQSARTARNTNRTRLWQQAQRRAYSSEGERHGTQQSGFLAGDLSWALGAAIVTIPSTWYLMQPQIERWNRPKGSGHGHGHEGERHDEHREESEGGEEGEGQESGEDKGEDESKEGGEGGDKSDDSNSEGGQQDTPDTSDDEGSENGAKEVDSGKNVEDVQFKGATSGGTKDKNEQGDTRKHIPDAKGGNKKRIESDYAKGQGEAQKPEEDPSDKDLAAPSKGVDDKSRTSQSGKQEGLSNADTKHSTDIANDPEKSTKAEGGPETAKNKGTVDPSRPQV